MPRTFYAMFDGEVLRPGEPLPVKPGARLKVTIDELSTKEKDGRPYSFIHALLSFDLKGPPDLSTNLDEYLYGGREWPDPDADRNEQSNE